MVDMSVAFASARGAGCVMREVCLIDSVRVINSLSPTCWICTTRMLHAAERPRCLVRLIDSEKQSAARQRRQDMSAAVAASSTRGAERATCSPRHHRTILGDSSDRSGRPTIQVTNARPRLLRPTVSPTEATTVTAAISVAAPMAAGPCRCLGSYADLCGAIARETRVTLDTLRSASRK